MTGLPDKGALGLGAGGGIFSTICCSLSMILVISGIIGMATAKGFAAYRPYTTLLSLLLVAMGTLMLVKRRNGVCDISTLGREKTAILTIGVSFALVYLLLTDKVLPVLMKTAKAVSMGG